MKTNESESAKIANHRKFYDATLYVKCEEKNDSLYWYGYDESRYTKKNDQNDTRLRQTVKDSW